MLYEMIEDERPYEEIKAYAYSLKDAGISVDSYKHAGYRQTAFDLAIEKSQYDVARLLAELGANVEGFQPSGWTPLYTAIFNGDVDAVKLLIELGANPNAETKDLFGDPESPLQMVCTGYLEINNRYEIACLLIDAGANIEFRNKDGRTPLALCFSNIDIRIAYYLVENGADVNARDNTGWTPFLLAVCNNIDDEGIIYKMVEAGANIHASPTELRGNAFTYAAHTKSLDMLKYLVSLGVSTTERVSYGSSALHEACSSDTNCTVEILSYLIEDLGLNVNAKSYGGSSPLMEAVYLGDCTPEIVEYLVDQGSDIKERADSGEGLLSLALKYNDNLDTARKLIELGADFSERDMVVVLCDSKHEDNIRFALSLGYSIDSKTYSGETALMRLCQSSYYIKGRIKLLLDLGADPMIKDDSGMTALDYARKNDNLKDTTDFWELSDAVYAGKQDIYSGLYLR